MFPLIIQEAKWRKAVIINTEEVDLAGSPDGMTIDGEGSLIRPVKWWSKIRKRGELFRKVELPCVETTAWPFQILNRLFVTTGIQVLGGK